MGRACATRATFDLFRSFRSFRLFALLPCFPSLSIDPSTSALFRLLHLSFFAVLCLSLLRTPRARRILAHIPDRTYLLLLHLDTHLAIDTDGILSSTSHRSHPLHAHRAHNPTNMARSRSRPRFALLSLLPTALLAFVLSSSLGEQGVQAATTCGYGSNCPKDSPCCSAEGTCGSGAFQCAGEFLEALSCLAHALRRGQEWDCLARSGRRGLAAYARPSERSVNEGTHVSSRSLLGIFLFRICSASQADATRSTLSAPHLACPTLSAPRKTSPCHPPTRRTRASFGICEYLSSRSLPFAPSSSHA